MKFGVLFCVAFVVAFGSAADAGTARYNEKTIFLNEDGTWRYSGDDGPECSKITEAFSICANPDDWHPYPLNIERYYFPQPKAGKTDVFRHDQNFFAHVKIWDRSQLTGPSMAHYLGYVKSQSRYDTGGRIMDSPTLERFESHILGAKTQTIVTQGGALVRAFSHYMSDTELVIVETVELNTTLIFNDHRELHQNFLDALTREQN
jgi:hypothetical protein